MPGPRSSCVDPGSTANLKTPRHWEFQQPHCATRETEAQGSPQLPLLSGQLILLSVFHVFTVSHDPMAPTQPVMDQLSDRGATLALSRPLSPPPHGVAGKALGPTPTQLGWVLSLLRLPPSPHL